MPRSDAFMVGTVEAAMDEDPVCVAAGSPLSDAVLALVNAPRHRAVYIVDGERRVLGAVSFRSVLRAVNARLGVRASGPLNMVRHFRDLRADTVDALMRPAKPLLRSAPLASALEAMEEMKENDLPVVDAEGRLVGELRGLEILVLAADAIRGTEDAVAAEGAPRSTGRVEI